MATILDIAKVCGVSNVTVSNVLNNKHGQVGEQTRRRVLEAARELDYRPNAIARSLRMQHTDTIGFYSGYGDLDARNPYLAEMLNGLLNQCDIQDNDLLLHGGSGIHTAESIYSEMANGKIDAVVLNTPPNDRLVELLAASSLPAVVVVDAVPDLPSVVVDDAGGARLLAAHLAGKGHRRIMYCVPGEIRGASVRRRLATFHETAASLGMTVVETIEAQDGWVLSAEQVEMLSAPRGVRPTAAVCWHDSAAYGLIQSCRARGMRVPEDLAVVGFNGVKTDVSRFCNLTTIRAPWVEMGRTAVSLAGDLIKNRTVAGETVLPVELIVGETT